MTNFHTQHANDFARTLVVMGESIVRRVKGDRTNYQTVTAIVELDSQAAGANVTEGTLNQRSDKYQEEPGGRIELLASQTTDPADTWEIDGDLWKQVGTSIGEDAASKTIVIRKVSRIRGRSSNVNTQV